MQISDVYFATAALALCFVAAEILLGATRWRATLATRAKLAMPLWALTMGIYLVFRLSLLWGAL